MNKLYCAISCMMTLTAVAFADDTKKDTPMTALDFKMTGLDGKEIDLNSYKGKVVLFVNVASKCG